MAANRLYGFDNSIRVTVGISDRAALEVASYKAFIESQGGAVEDEIELYNAYTSLISSGEIDKQCYLWGYKFGMLKDVDGYIAKMWSIVKVDGVYLEFSQATLNNRPLLTADYIEMYTNGYGRNMVCPAIPLLKKSFYIEEYSLKQYVSATFYTVLSDPASLTIGLATQSNNRCYVVTYNEGGASTAVSSYNNFYENNFVLYKTLYARDGDSCTPALYKNGSLIQTMASRTWDKSINNQFKIAGASTNTHRFKTFKICEV